MNNCGLFCYAKSAFLILPFTFNFSLSILNFRNNRPLPEAVGGASAIYYSAEII